MIKRVLIPTDGFGLEDHVIEYMAKAFPFADFHVISVVNTYERGVQLTNLLYDEMQDASMKAVREAEEKLHSLGIHNVKNRVAEGLPSREIVRYAKLNDVDLIAMRVYGRKSTASAHRLGSTVHNVLKISPIPVLTLADRCDRVPIKRLLLLTDGTAKTKRAENFAILLSSSYNLEMEVIYFSKYSNESGEKILKNVEWKANYWNVRIEKKIVEDEPKKIFEHLGENDIVVMGTGKKGYLSPKVGHVSLYMATHSPIPVIFVRKLKERWSKRISRR